MEKILLLTTVSGGPRVDKEYAITCGICHGWDIDCPYCLSEISAEVTRIPKDVIRHSARIKNYWPPIGPSYR